MGDGMALGEAASIQTTLAIVPVKEFVRNLPLTVALQQSEYIGSVGVGSSQLTRPVFDFEMDDGDRLDDLDACEAWGDIRRRAILVDPLKHMFYRTRIFDSLAESGDRG